MSGTSSCCARGRTRFLVAAFVVVSIGLAFVPQAAVTGRTVAPAGPNGGATFDLYCMFPEQMLAPAYGVTKAFFNFDTRNINDGNGPVELSVEPDSGQFQATVKPATVEPEGKDGKAKSRVDVTCSKDTPDGTTGWIKLTGTRGAESHRIWLKISVLASQPKLELSRGLPLTGPGYKDPVQQAFIGTPVSWKLAATDQGAVGDTYKLSFQAPAFECKVVFRGPDGKQIESVTRPGRTRNLLFAKPLDMTVEVTPLEELPVNEPQEFKVVLGPGEKTGATAEVAFQIVNPGMLYSASDLDGMRPHPHQVMPGETTSFVFHLTNFGDSPVDMALTPPAATGDWKVEMERTSFTGVEKGKPVKATMNVGVPASAKPGDRVDLTVTAESSDGSTAESRVAVEATDQRNVYYWAVDSMEPEYMYLNHDGTGPGSEGDWLMPNMQAFLKESVDYTNADVYLPSATDMNHTNALAGCYTGTQGIYMVGGTFKGFTEHDEVLSGPNTMDLMKYGPDGKPIQRVYDVAKQQTGGKALTGFWSNKNWLAELEGAGAVDIVGHSEKWPLFFSPPYKYRAAGDPSSDEDPKDPLSCSIRACFHSNNNAAVVIPTILGQFDVYVGLRLLSIPIALMFGKTPGMHAEDRYVADQFFTSITEEDPDVSYINVADLDNTGHFTGSSWDPAEWETNGTGKASDDVSKYSPWVRRDEAFDICREEDILFGEFVDLLKKRGVYDNSTIAFLSDHGMENMKDPKKGWDIIDLREILRDHGYVRHEDYEEAGGTEINFIWCSDPAKLAAIEQVLREFTVDDKDLGTVKPLTVVNRRQMMEGADFGDKGFVRPGELYSEYWTTHMDTDNGEIWPDLFVFPLDNYQVLAHGDALSSGINNVGFSLGINVPESVRFGLPGAHGGLETTSIPLVLKVPSGSSGYRPGTRYSGQVAVGDITPTIYKIMGWTPPENVDGKPLPE